MKLKFNENISFRFVRRFSDINIYIVSSFLMYSVCQICCFYLGIHLVIAFGAYSLNLFEIKSVYFYRIWKVNISSLFYGILYPWLETYSGSVFSVILVTKSRNDLMICRIMYSALIGICCLWICNEAFQWSFQWHRRMFTFRRLVTFIALATFSWGYLQNKMKKTWNFLKFFFVF